jgi:hypothetical protein
MKRPAKIRFVSRGPSMLFYPCRAAAVPPDLAYATGIIRHHHRQIGSPWRRLDRPAGAAVHAYLRKGETFADLAAGFRVGNSTA